MKKSSNKCVGYFLVGYSGRGGGGYEKQFARIFSTSAPKLALVAARCNGGGRGGAAIASQESRQGRGKQDRWGLLPLPTVGKAWGLFLLKAPSWRPHLVAHRRGKVV